MIVVDKETFSLEVETFVAKHGARYLDAILEVATDKGLELEVVPKLLTTRLKELLENESMQFNLIEKKDQLPL